MGTHSQVPVISTLSGFDYTVIMHAGKPVTRIGRSKVQVDAQEMKWVWNCTVVNVGRFDCKRHRTYRRACRSVPMSGLASAAAAAREPRAAYRCQACVTAC